MYAVSAGSCLRAIPSFRNRAEDLDGGVHGDVFHDPPGIEDGQPHTPVGTGSNTEEIGLVGDIGSVRLGGDTAEEEDPMMEEAGVTPGSHTLPRIEERVPRSGSISKVPRGVESSIPVVANMAYREVDPERTWTRRSLMLTTSSMSGTVFGSE